MKKEITIGLGTGEVQFCFMNVVQPVLRTGKMEPDYNGLILLDKTNCAADIALLQQTIAEVYEGSISDTFNGQRIQPEIGLHDGDVEKSGNPLFVNKMYFNTSSGFPVGLAVYNAMTGQVENVDRSMPGASDIFYSGSKGAMVVTVRAYNNQKKGIGIYMQHLLKVKDGEKLAGPETDASKVFSGASFDVPAPAFGAPQQPAMPQPGIPPYTA